MVPTVRSITADELETELVAFETARSIVLNSGAPGSSEFVDLKAALGRTLVNEITSPIDVPPFDNSSMDGWAVNSIDTGTTAPVSRIATGAPLPDGADAVVPWELATEQPDGTIVCERSIEPGDFVRRAGHDFARGTALMQASTTLTPAHLAVLASCGIAGVEVARVPRVAVVVSGDELVEPGSELEAGRVFDANSVLIASSLERAGVRVESLGRVGDNEEASLDALRRACANRDVVITTGGASVGERDWMRHALSTFGALDFWRVAMAPGRPFATGTVGTTRVFVLPGNPGSVFACLHAFVLPYLRLRQGQQPIHEIVDASLDRTYDNDGSRSRLLPVKLAAGVARPLPGHSSQALLHLGEANGMIVVEPQARLEAGETVQVEMIG